MCCTNILQVCLHGDRWQFVDDEVEGIKEPNMVGYNHVGLGGVRLHGWPLNGYPVEPKYEVHLM